jgi:glycosyltransferase involved in cell wall biosynthesis
MKPKISFIIPCYNEQQHLEACLNSICDQTALKSNFEIIVADNGSTDDSHRIATIYADKVLSVPGRNVGAVRNAGAKQATGDILAFIDADCTIDKSWFLRVMTLSCELDETIYGGGALLPASPTWVEKYWLIEGKEGNTLPRDLIGCSIVIKKGVFKKTQGFNEHMASGEDSEFSERLKQLGFSICITRDLNVIHHGNAKTIVEFIKRQSWHGQSYRRRGTTNLKDPVFLITILFILLISNGIILVQPVPLLFAVTVLPVILSVKRLTRSRQKCFDLEFTKIYILDLMYLTGRSVGVLRSMLK